MNPEVWRDEALARAHDMRLMRDAGIPLNTIASYYGYLSWTVEKMIDWHIIQFPVMPQREPQTISWHVFKLLRPNL